MLNYETGSLRLDIADDGIGFDINNQPAAQLGMGLKSMQNRAALIGAQFSLQSSQNTEPPYPYNYQLQNHKPFKVLLMAKIVLTDDHSLLRNGLAELVKSQGIRCFI